MLLPYFLLIAVAAGLAVAALISSMFRRRTVRLGALLGAWGCLGVSVGIMVYSIFAASATHGGSGEKVAYALATVSTLIGFLSLYLSARVLVSISPHEPSGH